MTAVDVGALDELRGALAAAARERLPRGTYNPAYETDADDIANALLPVVDRIANERAAAELRAAADWLGGNGDGPAAPRWPEALPRADVAAMLHGRADEFAELGCPDCESPFHGRPCPRAALAQPTGDLS